jgi:hypothetical protein
MDVSFWEMNIGARRILLKIKSPVIPSRILKKINSREPQIHRILFI